MSQVSDKERVAIQVQVNQILEKFSKSLEGVKIMKTNDKSLLKDSGFRQEHQGKATDLHFKEIMFKNAPKHNSVSLIAEKKEW